MSSYGIAVFGRRKEPTRVVVGFGTEQEALDYVGFGADSQTVMRNGEGKLYGDVDVLIIEDLAEALGDRLEAFAAHHDARNTERAEAQARREAAQLARHQALVEEQRQRDIRDKAEQLRIAEERSRKAKYLREAQKLIDGAHEKARSE